MIFYFASLVNNITPVINKKNYLTLRYIPPHLYTVRTNNIDNENKNPQSLNCLLLYPLRIYRMLAKESIILQMDKM